MVDAVVEHDYIAKGPLELTIKKGEIIKDVVKKQDGWWEGLLRDKRGIFPDNFVKPLERETTLVYRNKKDVNRIRQCRVAFSYTQNHEDELNLNVGEIIDVLGEDEEGWWRGILNGKEGVFPSNFVVEITKSGSRENLPEIDGKIPSLPPKPAKLLCEVKFAYKAENSDELNLKEGDIVTVLSQEGTDPGWWFGELNGRTGVFPDNFVVLLPTSEDHHDKKQSTLPKANSVASQRKSLEVKTDKIENDISHKTTPPLPSKKPLLPIKKSPSGSSCTGGIFSGIKKKFADAVDGTSISKTTNKMGDNKSEISGEVTMENAFDQVERRPLLSDVRATRAKAPGRRPPSVVLKEGEPGVVNGNMDHNTNLDTLAEQLTNSNSSIDQETAVEQKPKLREWEKHRAPWLEEMKLNQAKRTSTSPGPEQNKLKLQSSDPIPSLKPTPSPEKSDSPEDSKTKESSPAESPKQLNFGGRLKTPPGETEKGPGLVALRNKVGLPTTPLRPQTIHAVNDAAQGAKQTQPQVPAKVFVGKISPSPPLKAHVVTDKAEKTVVEVGSGDSPSQESSSVSQKQYTELVERVQKLEALLEKQQQAHTAAIEELRSRLQVETDLRIMLQAEVEKIAQCVMQV